MTWPRLRVLALISTASCAPDFSPDAFDQPMLLTDAGSVSPPTSMTDDDAGQDGDNEPVGELPVDMPTGESGAGAGEGEDGCDLTGRWLTTERAVTSAVGSKQLINNWFYLELSQQGSVITVTRSLACGVKVVGVQPVVVGMDDSKAWPSYMVHPTYEGRIGSSQPSAQGCQVSFEKAVIVRGATVDTYRDMSVPLPKMDQQASGSAPGWEDWDGDGKPGYSLRISGSLTGTLYAATRTWNQTSGEIPASARSFTLAQNWSQERSTLGYEGSPLLTADAARDGDASQHFVEYARLSEAQVQGDDAAVCAAVRQLAATLTPKASK